MIASICILVIKQISQYFAKKLADYDFPELESLFAWRGIKTFENSKTSRNQMHWSERLGNAYYFVNHEVTYTIWDHWTAASCSAQRVAYIIVTPGWHEFTCKKSASNISEDPFPGWRRFAQLHSGQNVLISTCTHIRDAWGLFVLRDSYAHPVDKAVPTQQ